MKRTTLYLALWILGCLATIFGLLSTAVVATEPALFQPAGLALAFFSVCTIVFALPTVVFFLLWRREAKRRDQLEAVGAILRGYRELPVAELAKRLNKGPAEAEALAAAAVSAGYAQGYVDRATATFMSGAVYPAQVAAPPVVLASPTAAVTPTVENRFCRECGTRVNRIPGTNSWQCPACGNVQ